MLRLLRALHGRRVIAVTHAFVWAVAAAVGQSLRAPGSSPTATTLRHHVLVRLGGVLQQWPGPMQRMLGASD